MAAATSTFNKLRFPLALLAFFILLTKASSHGFSVNLVHRDSPLSPLYNSSISHFDRLHNAFRRSITRVNHFVKPRITSSSAAAASSETNIESKIIPSAGEYLMNISIGSPPVEVLGIADTGSDLIWTQCKPCKQCFNQNPPLFDPKKSSTYRSIPCQSNSCSNLEEASCGTNDQDDQDTCEYRYGYGDRSFTRGTLALETFTIGSTSGRPISLPKLVFGCGHENGGTFDESGSGLIGLGGGSLSLISQLTKSTNGGKFSYCLAPLSSNSTNSNNVASKISFGSAGIVSGAGAVSTPLVAKEPDTFYYLTLEGISVGEKRLAYKTKSPNCDEHVDHVAANEGNIIIDSGTTLTLLPPGFHDDLVSALEAAINAERVSDPRGVLSLCFRSRSDDIGVPVITAHFSGGADVKLQALNTFARMEDDMVCLTMISSSDGAIFGNLAQMNFLVGYDLEERTVSFKPADCTKH